jgi:hypothetical protein
LAMNPIILHDNERPHTADAVKSLLHHWQWEILERLSYSPDMSPCEYNLFTKMKEPLQGTCYNMREEIICAVGWSLLNINSSGCTDGVQ